MPASSDTSSSYCFFLSKELLCPGSRFRMADDLLEAYLRQLIEAQAGAPGYTDINGQTTGSVHHLESFTPTASACAPPPPPGGGGSGGPAGGCAVALPSSPARPAEVPHLHTC